MYSMAAAEDKYFISGDRDYHVQFNQIRGNFNEKINALVKIAHTGARKDILSNLEELQSLFGALEKRQRVLSEHPRLRAALLKTYLAGREEIIRDIDHRLRTLAKISTDERSQKLQESRDVSERVTNFITMAEILAIILVLIITFINTRKINLPIKLLGERTKEIAGGKFCNPLNIPSPPEIKELADSFNRMCERLSELDQMKIDYISHLSHELRTPLTVIKEASLMLKQGVLSKSPEKQDELFEIIRMECERLISSVNRTLDLSRMEAGDMFFSFQEAALRPIIEKSILQLTPLIRSKRMDVQLEIDEGLPLVKMDSERIEEVLENLLGNALKYTPDGGKIIISVAKKRNGQTIEISVTDNGIGIPDDGLQQVFDKFKRVDDGRIAVRGTGLGLAIVKHVINAHGGNIWVKSKVSEGSTFTFSLPVS